MNLLRGFGMYQAESSHNHFLQALSSSVLDGMIDFLIAKRDDYKDKLQRSAISALDDKSNVPYALRQVGAVDALEDLIFTLSTYRKTKEHK